MNYYKRHLGDYAKKTAHLSALEHGVYNLLIDACYIRERGVTYAEAIRFARASTPAEIAATETVLAEYFTARDGFYFQSRIEDELARYREVAAVNKAIAIEREAAKRGETKGKQTGTNRARSVHAPSTNRSPSHKPLAISHKEAKSKSLARASRLPDDWQPTPELVTWAQRERPDVALRVEIEVFRDYWHARPGAGALKLDWAKTFRNWIRKAEGGKHHGRRLSAVEQVERDIFENHNRRPT